MWLGFNISCLHYNVYSMFHLWYLYQNIACLYLSSSDLELKKKASILFGIRFDNEMYETLKKQLDNIYDGRDLVSHNHFLLRLTHQSIFIFSFCCFTCFLSQAQDITLQIKDFKVRCDYYVWWPRQSSIVCAKPYSCYTPSPMVRLTKSWWF